MPNVQLSSIAILLFLFIYVQTLNASGFNEIATQTASISNTIIDIGQYSTLSIFNVTVTFTPTCSCIVALLSSNISQATL